MPVLTLVYAPKEGLPGPSDKEAKRQRWMIRLARLRSSGFGDAGSVLDCHVPVAFEWIVARGYFLRTPAIQPKGGIECRRERVVAR